MRCFHPKSGYRLPNGVFTLRQPVGVALGTAGPDTRTVPIRCGTCLGCRMARAREWALRCNLELQDHDHACWTTLTYDDARLPPTLSKRDLSLWLKRLRKAAGATKVRFFASGEYGDTTYRPHYHAILFGLPHTTSLVQETWTHGFARVDPISPAAISYVAGYCSKKIGYKLDREEKIDYRTGELYTFQPPFLQMSRRPGIAGTFRQHHDSWRSHAVLNGTVVPVPRFLHQAWLNRASPEDLKKLEDERTLRALQENQNYSLDYTKQDRSKALEQIALARHKHQTERRTL